MRVFRRKKSYPGDSPPPGPPLPYLTSTVTLSAPQLQTTGFFSLPVELRRDILLAAFGRQYVHINLLPLALYDLLHNEKFHHYDRRSQLDRLRHRTWGYRKLVRTSVLCWRGCVCERTIPGEEDPSKRPIHNIRCLHGEGRCIEWPRSGPEQPTLDAMGFLLSCKQGYLDLVDILYSSNTILLNTTALIDAVISQAAPGTPKIISPMIHHVTSLELFVNFRLFQHPTPEEGLIAPAQTDARRRFRKFIAELPEAFPHLRRLHIGFNHCVYYAFPAIPLKDDLDNIRKIVMDPLKEMGEKLSLQHFSTSMDRTLHTLFWTLNGNTKVDAAIMQERDGYYGVMAWYPPETSREERGRPGTGFWIRQGPDRNVSLDTGNRLVWDYICCPSCHRGCLG